MDDTSDISARIEALLFYKGEPVSVRFLSETLKISEEIVREALASLEQSFEGRGIVLMRIEDEVCLSTAPQMGQMIETLVKEELNKELGRAGLETLSIVLYRGPIARSEINYIRGVNSNHILRALLVRGLIEKVEETGKEGGSRSTVYRPTFELLSYMGIRSVKDLPEYEQVHTAVDTFKEEDKKQTETYEEEPDQIDDADSEAQ
jgi:segregation and condensation protein B